MTIRMNVRGNTVFSTVRRHRSVAGHAPPSAHNEHMCHPGMHPDDDDANPDAQPLRSGEPSRDPEDGIIYRLVDAGRLKANEGWKPTAEWAKQLRVRLTILRQLVQLGLFDAAREKGSGFRCLRALDMARIKATLDMLRKGPVPR